MLIAPVDMQIGEEIIKQGTWLVGTVWNNDVFQKIEAGQITGYSMGGTGIREDVPDNSLNRFQEALESIHKTNGNGFQNAIRGELTRRGWSVAVTSEREQ